MSRNEIVVSAAGSRKTTRIVKEAIAKSSEKIAITTYTIENTEQIRVYFNEDIGFIPSNVQIQTWFTFLLTEFARPYRNYLIDNRIESIAFVHGQSTRGIMKSNTKRYYFSERKIYNDKLSEFIIRCNEASSGLVIKRLEQRFDVIYIDEAQDMAGYDLDLIELLFKSNIDVVLVADPRQGTYSTNHSSKNKKYRKSSVIEKFSEWKLKGLCLLTNQTKCYRSNQSICDFADFLYPNELKTESVMNIRTEHDGVFVIRESQVAQYQEKYKAQVLRFNKKSNSFGYPAQNFGVVKGKTFDRVLIIPTAKIREFISTGNIDQVGDISKFYVACTRARYSLAIVLADNLKISEKLGPLIQLFE
ncbi:MAG: UvrD-helicase domain-containing protein [Cryomorphaceae bacterium]